MMKFFNYYGYRKNSYSILKSLKLGQILCADSYMSGFRSLGHIYECSRMAALLTLPCLMLVLNGESFTK